MSGRVKVERGSGNVFTDLGFSGAAAENLMLRAQLMSEIREVVRGTTQSNAAKRFGITQPQLNDLLRGKLISSAWMPSSICWLPPACVLNYA